MTDFLEAAAMKMLYFGSVYRTADYKRPNKELVRLNKIRDAQEQAYYDGNDMSQGSRKYRHKLYFQPPAMFPFFVL